MYLGSGRKPNIGSYFRTKSGKEADKVEKVEKIKKNSLILTLTQNCSNKEIYNNTERGRKDFEGQRPAHLTNNSVLGLLIL